MAEAKAPDAPPMESEAKLRASRRAFAALDGVQEVAGWRVAGRHDVSLRDTYWDTPDGRLARAGSTLRVREERTGVAGAGTGSGARAELTLKGPIPDAATPSGAVWHRSELTAPVPAGSGPAEWAKIPEAKPVLDALAALDARAGTGAAGDSRPPGAGTGRGGLLERLRPDVV